MFRGCVTSWLHFWSFWMMVSRHWVTGTPSLLRHKHVPFTCCWNNKADVAWFVSQLIFSPHSRGLGFQLLHWTHEKDESKFSSWRSNGYTLCKHALTDPGNDRFIFITGHYLLLFCSKTWQFFSTIGCRFWTLSCLSWCTRMETTPTFTSATGGFYSTLNEVKWSWRVTVRARKYLLNLTLDWIVWNVIKSRNKYCGKKNLCLNWRKNGVFLFVKLCSHLFLFSFFSVAALYPPQTSAFFHISLLYYHCKLPFLQNP